MLVNVIGKKNNKKKNALDINYLYSACISFYKQAAGNAHTVLTCTVQLHMQTDCTGKMSSSSNTVTNTKGREEEAKKRIRKILYRMCCAYF